MKRKHSVVKKRKETFYWRDIFLVAVILIIGIFIGLVINIPTSEIITSLPELSGITALSLQGFVRVNASVIPNIITLNSECHEITMVTTNSQTFSIISGIEGVRGFRPLTHDLITDMVETFNMNVLMTKIERLEEGTYFAKLFVQQGNKVLSLDSKPSDAIAISVRTNSPIYIKQSLIEEHGRYTC